MIKFKFVQRLWTLLSPFSEISSNSSFFIHSSPYSFKIILIFNFVGHNTNVTRVKNKFYFYEIYNST